MSEEETPRELILKIIGRQVDIFSFLNELPKLKYPSDSMKVSGVNKNEKDENYHLFVKIILGKAPPNQLKEVP